MLQNLELKDDLESWGEESEESEREEIGKKLESEAGLEEAQEVFHEGVWDTGGTQQVLEDHGEDERSLFLEHSRVSSLPTLEIYPYPNPNPNPESV